MKLENLKQQIEQFNAFYLIQHPIKTNVIAISPEQANQSMQAFEQSMPYAFKISSEMSEIESKALRPFRNMGEKFEDLVDYLQMQAKKMDLMLSYILQQQDEEAHRATALKFGGGGVVIESTRSSDIGSYAIVKLFLESESAAVYCIAQVIACEQQSTEDASSTSEDKARYEVSYAYTLIREEDQELLVRASLHLQTAQLRKNNSSE
ncbi:PilZ domain-containing protein [Ningiella sp. W23]|uniref:PilZ domain-containing protein n=1 Tax=Ningiella sp. W23 TaxID=3023715 RepID=UPI003756EA18